MADFTPLGAMVKAPQPMSMGDMVNLARGVQAYQQAEQINPLEVQTKQQAARTGQINLGVTEQTDLERKNMQRFFSDPANFQTNGRIDLDKINAAVPSIAPLTGEQYIKKYTDLGQAQTQAISAKQNLTQDQRSMIGSRLAVLGRAGITDKNAYLAEMDLLAKENPENKDLSSLIDAYKRTWQYIPSGPGLPNVAIAGAQTLLTPAQQETAFGPKITESGGRTTTITPSVAGQPPTATIGVAGGLAGSTTGAPSAQQAPASVGGMQLPYPKRSASQPYIPEPNEAADQASGVKYREGLVGRQTDISTSKRNLDEVISAATGLGPGKWYSSGVVGAARRKLSEIAGDPSYKQLSKDLANVQISNIQALGGSLDTVAGQQLMKMANGDETYPPDVLLNIARRAYSDLTNLDMQATGAEKFSQKYGDNNMKVYRQMWSKNADSKVFEAISIYNNVSDPEERKKEIDKLMGSDPQKRKEFAEKYRNIKKLTETGEL